MSTRRAERSHGCPPARRLTEYARGELPHADRARVEIHLQSCEICRGEVEEIADVVALLADSTPRDPGVDVSERVLAQIPDASWRRVDGRRQVAVGLATVLSIAAVLVVSTVVVFWESGSADRRSGETPAAATQPVAVERALLQARDWLIANQEPSGAWAPRRWGGAPEYRVALTGLATLALAGDDRRPAREAVGRAGQFLIESQGADGRLGSDFRSSLYNHAIGTLALAELARVTGAGGYRQSAAAAVGQLVESQIDGGAWGYSSGGRTIENESISIWALQALTRARAAGIRFDSRALERGFDWFERSFQSPPTATYLGYDAHVCGSGTSPLVSFAVLSRDDVLRDELTQKTVRAAVDRLVRQSEFSGDGCFYDGYFVSHALDVASNPVLGMYGQRARRWLVESQVSSGQFTGTWEPQDRWSPIGGRIYSTAFAALALQR